MTKQKQILKYKRRKKLKCNVNKIIEYFNITYPTINIKCKIGINNSVIFKCNGEILLKASYKGVNGNVIYWALHLSNQNRMVHLLQKHGIKIGRDFLIRRDEIYAPKFIKRIREIEDKLKILKILKITIKLKRKVINGEH